MERVYFEDYSNITKEKSIERKICRLAANFYRQKLFSNEGNYALDYHLDLTHNISADAILDFKIGFAPESSSELIEYLQNRGFSTQELSRSSLFNIDENENLQGVFQNRLMFPIQDEYGNYIGFCGRSIDEKAIVKHIISSKSPAFDPKEHLYGLNSAQGFDKLILCESYFDVVKLTDIGLENTVAAFCTFLSLEQANLLKKHTDKVLLYFDDDELGARFAAHAMSMLEKVGVPTGIFY